MGRPLLKGSSPSRSKLGYCCRLLPKWGVGSHVHERDDPFKEAILSTSTKRENPG